MAERTIALLVAAGLGSRMGSDMPKPYLQLGETSVLRRAVMAFLGHKAIDGVRVVIRREHHAYYKKAIEGLSLFPCVIGGASRQESVRLGLESLEHRRPERVLVHDVARPLAGEALISRVVRALDAHPAAIPALPLTDTVKRVKGRAAMETLPREQLVTVQTPQGFHFAPLLAAHRRFAGLDLPDDAAVMERAGENVLIVDGERDNIKITRQEDIRHMQSLLAIDSETRTGIGYDVHGLKAHDPDTPVTQQTIKLCGIKIPSAYFLAGHSDADVGLHALVDAILGAIGAGDIGMHFPPDDRKWQGAESGRFLMHAYELLHGKGGELVHLDVTLICERPRIADYRQAMIDHIAQMLKISPDRVSVKATTTEKLGFTGRGEGIAAQAVATVRLPRS